MTKINATDKLTIKSDGLNWTVYKRTIIQKQDSANYGKEALTDPAYFGKIEDMAAYLVRQVPGPDDADLRAQLAQLQQTIEDNTRVIITMLKLAVENE